MMTTCSEALLKFKRNEKHWWSAHYVSPCQFKRGACMVVLNECCHENTKYLVLEVIRRHPTIALSTLSTLSLSGWVAIVVGGDITVGFMCVLWGFGAEEVYGWEFIQVRSKYQLPGRICSWLLLLLLALLLHDSFLLCQHICVCDIFFG